MSFGPYTDPLPYGGWDENTVGYLIDRSLSDLDRSLNDSVTRLGCYAWITEGLREITGKQIRWPDLYIFNHPLTTIAAGDYRYTLPTNIYDDESVRSILAVRVGNQGNSLAYIDPIEFEQRLNGMAETTAAEAGSVGETDIDLANASDFAAPGAVEYFASGSKFSFTYTGKTGNTLTGIPASGNGSITQAFSSGDTMYQGLLAGIPDAFTVRNGSLDVVPVPEVSLHGKQIHLDYATEATRVDSDGDTIDVKRFDIMQAYLTWRMECKFTNSGKLDFESGFYLKFKERLNDAIRTLPKAVKFKRTPPINTMRRR